MVFIKMLQTKTAINPSRAMRNVFIYPKFLFKSNTMQPFLSNYTIPRAVQLKTIVLFLQTKREIFRAYQSSQKIFRVRRSFFNPTCFLPINPASERRFFRVNFQIDAAFEDAAFIRGRCLLEGCIYKRAAFKIRNMVKPRLHVQFFPLYGNAISRNYCITVWRRTLHL